MDIIKKVGHPNVKLEFVSTCIVYCLHTTLIIIIFIVFLAETLYAVSKTLHFIPKFFFLCITMPLPQTPSYPHDGS